MKLRWILATGSALALALLTMPGLPLAFPAAEALAIDGATCDADAKPANLDFIVQDMNGDDVNLASFKGKVILLNFWATWCGPCKYEIPAFVELQEEYGDEGLVVLGLSVDDPIEKLKPFAEEYKVNYPLLVGLGQDELMEAFGPLWGIPVTTYISRDGTLCKRHMGIATKEQVEEDIKALLQPS